MFSCYLCLEQLPDSIKEQNGIKVGASTPRFDLTRMAGSLPGLEALTNKRGQVVMYLQECRGIINSPDGRRADCFLMAKNSLNFSSIYLLNRTTEGAPYIGFGNPLSAQIYGKDNHPNPFYQSRNDGYIFICAPDWSKIEVLVVPDGKFTIVGEAGMVLKGEMVEAIDTIRQHSHTFYPYGGGLPKLW